MCVSSKKVTLRVISEAGRVFLFFPISFFFFLILSKLMQLS